MKYSEEIEGLIEKYYNGETSLKEEQQLQEFFLGEVVPDHLKSYQAQFRHLNERSQATWSDFSEAKLFARLDAQVQQEQAPKVVAMPRQKASVELWFYRIAAAVALVLVGYFAGRPTGNEELSELKALMTASLEASSASSRMQAVNNSLELPPQQADEELLDVLTLVALKDPNMNVRMKGVEALARFGNDETVRQTLIEALITEKEPAVKIALIEALVGLGEKGALENLEKLAGDQDNMKAVRDEARLGVFRLKEM